MTPIYNITLDLKNPKAGNYFVCFPSGRVMPVTVYTHNTEPYFSQVGETDMLPLDYIAGYNVYAAAPKEVSGEEPRDLPAAYLQSFINDSRFDMLINLLPDALLDKLYRCIESLRACRDDWKCLAEERGDNS